MPVVPQMERLERLAAEFEEKARALRTAVSVLREHEGAVAVKTIDQKVVQAAKLRGHGKQKKQELIASLVQMAWRAGALVKVREVTAAIKAQHGLTVTPSHVGLTLRMLRARKIGRGTSTRWAAPRAKVKTQADARTAAVANGNGAHAKGNGSGPSALRLAVDEQRRMMLDLLARFDRKRPRTTADLREGWVKDGKPVLALRGVGSLVRRGYLRKKGDGYVATAKTYEPTLLDGAPA